MSCAHGRDFSYLLFRIHGPCGVVRAVEYEHLRLFRDGGLYLGRGDLVAALRARRHIYGHAAHALYDLGVGQPVGDGDYDLVSGVYRGIYRVEYGMLRAVGHDDLRRLVFETVVIFQFFAYGLFERRNAGRGHIFRISLVESVFCRIAYICGRIEIGLAYSEVQNPYARGFHVVRFSGNRKRHRGCDGGYFLRYVHRLFSP